VARSRQSTGSRYLPFGIWHL